MAALSLVAIAPAWAAEPALPACFVIAASRSGVSETLLRAIGKVESNYRADAVHRDADGTHDVGIMQINSSHFVRLQALGISEAMLLSEPCTNVAVGASILAGFIRQFGMTWRAVGCYGAGTHPKKEAARVAYATLVQRSFDRIVNTSAPGSQTLRTSASVTAPAASSRLARLLVLE